MRTIGLLVASMFVSHVALADDALQPRTEPASPETNDADYTNTRFTAGTAVFVASYAASAIVAGTSDHEGANRLYIPVAGPWMALNDWNTCNGTQLLCSSTNTDKALLIADGVVQAAGLVVMIDGLMDPTSAGSRMVVADTKLHFAPSSNGAFVWSHF
jgi:hypothetical protein